MQIEKSINEPEIFSLAWNAVDENVAMGRVFSHYYFGRTTFRNCYQYHRYERIDEFHVHSILLRAVKCFYCPSNDLDRHSVYLFK